MKRYLLLICALVFSTALLFSLGGCDLIKLKVKPLPDQIVVHENDYTFHPNKITITAGESFSKTVTNKLKTEALTFYLLKKDEDPLLVQQLKVQKGDVPEDYFLFKSDEIAPQSALKIEFNAPKEKGVYHFVGISDSPKESLYGTLKVSTAESESLVMDKEDSGYESKN